MSISEQFKTMTVDCIDLPATWSTLVRHFEGKAAADQIAAEADLQRLSLSEKGDIRDFLNQVKLIRIKLSSCGAPISDNVLFQTVVKKLPSSMRGLLILSCGALLSSKRSNIWNDRSSNTPKTPSLG
jgi:hypothetical protein